MTSPIARMGGVLAAILSATTWSPPAGACSVASFYEGPANNERRVLTADDLATLNDIGSDPDFPGEPIFSISPDGERIAVQVRRAQPGTNSHCLGMAVVSVRGGGARFVDVGGEAMTWAFPAIQGKANFPTGFARVVTPSWSGDGRYLYYLRKDGGRRVWRAALDGTPARPISPTDVDVSSFRLEEGGASILYQVDDDYRRAREAIAAEGLTGHRFDERSSPVWSSTPFVQGPQRSTTFRLDTGNGASRPSAAGSREAAGSPFAAAFGAIGTVTVDHGRFPVRERLVATMADGSRLSCPTESCLDPLPFRWWRKDGSVLFARHEGWGGEKTAFYSWRPGSDAPKLLLHDSGRFLSCVAWRDDAICAFEESARPRRIVRLDLKRARVRTIFDPNPTFGTLRLGRVERLLWTHAGTRVWGDLVFPVGYRPGRRYPLVVVQYGSRGFLRGGTGDEYPIQAFAGRGYLVLSYEQPDYAHLAPGARNYEDFDREVLRDFKVRKANLGSIEEAVRMLVRRGLVDAGRVGLTGLSDGASTVQFALIHSTTFSAAAMSTCCLERGQNAIMGPTLAKLYERIGWPKLTDQADEFWSGISLISNAGRMRVPVLMQLAEHEYLAAVGAFTALREKGAPATMYTFPGEYHVKWQPAHRLAIYKRNLAWFDFWLNPCRQASKADAALQWEWRELREGATKAAARTSISRSKPRCREAP